MKEIDKHIHYKKSTVSTRHTENVINITRNSSTGKEKKKRHGKKSSAGNGNGSSEDVGNIKKFEDIVCLKRSYLIHKLTDECEYCLILLSEEDFEGDIKIFMAGDDTDYSSELLEARSMITNSLLDVSGSFIKDIKLFSGKQEKIQLRIKSKNKNALIVN